MKGAKAFALFVVCSAVLAACGSGSTHGPGATSGPTSSVAEPATTAPLKDVRIGVLSASRLGIDQNITKGIKLSISQAEGANPHLRVSVYYSSASGVSGAARAARRLLRVHVVAVLGLETPRLAAGADPVLSKAGVPAISVSLGQPDLSRRHWASFLRANPDWTQQGVATADELVEKLGCAEVSLFSEGSLQARTIAGSIDNQVLYDGSAIGPAPTPQRLNARSFGKSRRPLAALATSVANANPSCVAFVGTAVHAGRVADALVTAGFSGKFLAFVLDGKGLFLLSGGAKGDGAYLVSPFADTSTFSQSNADSLVFLNSYRSSYGRIPTMWSAEAYDAASFVIQEAQVAQDGQGSLLRRLRAGTWNGVAQLLRFESDGNLFDPSVFVAQVEHERLQADGTSS